MRLKQIKLAGFKSFVDITNISFQQQMTAIIGPNGCGKSNIIDAVRWVLGESSAKNLRGEALTDVIFNGAAHRKPIGLASIELIFENTETHLKDSVANRNEISIRRVVTRDAVSNYYLNGSKCRRRDITDIFLGTGLGPRSYAIIEQGTISRLIESKPQELRIFIEEAAGISKYKEKRRDTENRIRRTRENLARLTDVIVELNYQIDKLHQQSEAAKRFKTLKVSERKYKAELMVMRWQQFDSQIKKSQRKMGQVQSTLESLLIQQKKQEIEQYKNAELLTNINEQLIQYQQQKLQLSNNITRAEETIKHTKQQQINNEKQLKKLTKNHQQRRIEQQTEQEKLVRLTLELAENLPELKFVEEQIEQNRCDLSEKQTVLQQNIEQWQYANQQINQSSQKLASLEAKIDAQQMLIKHLFEQIVQINNDIKRVSLCEQDQKCIFLQVALEQEEDQINEIKNEKIHLDAEANALKQQKIDQQKKLFIKQAKHEVLISSLKQLQQRAQQLPGWYNQQKQWQQQNKLTSFGQLYKQVMVEPKWQHCVESVLSYWLTAEIIAELPYCQLNTKVETEQNTFPNTLLFIKKTTSLIQNKAKVGTLAEKIIGNDIFNFWLNTIYCVDSFGQAQAVLVNLKAHESVICVDGSWLSHSFFRKGLIKQNDNLLVNTEALKQNDNELYILTKQIKTAQNTLCLLNEQLTNVSKKQDQQNQKFGQLTIETQQRKQNLVLAQQIQQQQNQQMIELKSKQIQQNNLHEQQVIKLSELIKHRDDMLSLQQQSDKQLLEQLTIQRKKLQQGVENLQCVDQQCQQKKHQLSLQMAKIAINKENIEQKIVELINSQIKLEQELSQQKQCDQKQYTPLHNEEEQLQKWLKKMSLLENKMIIQHQQLSTLQENNDNLNAQKTLTVIKIAQLKEQINEHYLNSQSSQLRAESAIEQLAQMQQNIAQVVAKMPSNARESHWQQQIVRLTKEINQLGAINLTAIDEYTKESTRKIFLEQQYQDLNQAIMTLENAMMKIDRQSRQQFKNTFDQINKDLNYLFPRVFGGGDAYLTLTDEDLLETGVTIMARPPGKKNSTIQLLSGGEKTLTALSLVFAIFRLNPAPFCMLDEVDAPLDDANVVRFCDLVKEMSKTVQFIYISHNKIAMEMAAQLIGVTMIEAGVSRMVAVDIDKAVALAEL